MRRADAPASCGLSIDLRVADRSARPIVKVRRNQKNLIRGRFARGRLPEVEAFTASLPFDRRLFRHDIRGSIAHAQMLAKVGLLKTSELRAIVGGLDRIESEIANGRFKFDIADEDIHLAIERRLIALIGEPGRKLHTGRSRNDQIALDMRLYLRDEIAGVIALVGELRATLPARSVRDPARASRRMRANDARVSPAARAADACSRA